MKFTIFIGPSALGKSTKSRELCLNGNTISFNRDTLRVSLTKMNNDVYWNLPLEYQNKIENVINGFEKEFVDKCIFNELNGVFDNTNLSISNLKDLCNYIKFIDENSKIEFIFLLEEISIEYKLLTFKDKLQFLIERDNKRQNFVGRSVLTKQLKKYEENFPEYKKLEESLLVEHSSTFDKKCCYNK